MNDGDQITHVKIVPEPQKPTVMEIYVYDPLDYITINFFRLSIFLLFIAVVSDMMNPQF